MIGDKSNFLNRIYMPFQACGILCLLLALAGCPAPDPVPTDLNAFSQEWRSASESRKQQMFSFVVGQPLKRHRSYEFTGTMFECITLNELENFLSKKSVRVIAKGDGIVAPNCEISIYFDLGSIEADPIGGLVPGIAKRDLAEFAFDAKTEVIVALRTSS